MSNYPPGVTGNEYQIQGPDWEREDVRYCPTCDSPVDGMLEGYRHEVSFWHYAENGDMHDIDLTEEFTLDRDWL